jgi:hypothetical protein
MPLWQAILLSLGLDLLIATFATPRVPLSTGFALASVSALIALPFVDQQRVHKILSRLRGAHKKGISAASARIPLIMVALASVAILGKSIAFIGVSGLFPALAIIIVLGGVIKHGIQTYREGQRDLERLRDNAWSTVARWEQQLVIVSLAPMLFARIISLCGAFSIVSEESKILRLIFFGTSLLFLLMLRPHKAFFLSSCKRCKQPVPIVLSDLGSCLGCDRDLREKFLNRHESIS